MKKFLILIEDDFEIMGNGQGNVAELQYLPALSLMNIANKYNIKITFMVDIAHKLTLEQLSTDHPELKIQNTILDDTMLLMKDMGHDVQLHLHPQWLNSKYKEGHFYLSSKWNIGLYSQQEQHNLIQDAVNHLTKLLCKQNPEYKVCAFKAGSWGMQPSKTLLTEFKKIGINIVIGVREGLQAANQSIDYTNLEEKHLPYYPDSNDITRLATNTKNPVVIPLQPYAPDLLTFSKYIFNQITTKLRYNHTSFYYKGDITPHEIKTLNPIRDRKMFTVGIRPYRTHLKIGNQSFSYLKSSFDYVIRKLDKLENKRIPIIIESHTKQYHHYYKDIDKFFAYIINRYGSKIEFGDMSSFSKELKEQPDIARTKDVT
jgi:hypothetical protein